MSLSIQEIGEQPRLADDDDFQRIMQSDALPPITLLVPAYNESATVVASVTALLTLEYRNFEVIVVNDGSRDDTLDRSEEHTSELQSPCNLVCRLLLEKKKKTNNHRIYTALY